MPPRISSIRDDSRKKKLILACQNGELDQV